MAIYQLIHALEEENRYGNQAVLEGSIHRLYQMFWELLNNDRPHPGDLPSEVKEGFKFNGECILQKIREDGQK